MQMWQGIFDVSTPATNLPLPSFPQFPPTLVIPVLNTGIQCGAPAPPPSTLSLSKGESAPPVILSAAKNLKTQPIPPVEDPTRAIVHFGPDLESKQSRKQSHISKLCDVI